MLKSLRSIKQFTIHCLTCLFGLVIKNITIAKNAKQYKFESQSKIFQFVTFFS